MRYFLFVSFIYIGIVILFKKYKYNQLNFDIKDICIYVINAVIHTYILHLFKDEYLIHLFMFVLFVMAIYDIQDKSVPTLGFIILIAITVIFLYEIKITIQIRVCVALISMLGLFCLNILKKDSIGSGDIYFIGIVSMWFDPMHFYMCLSISYFSALIYALYLYTCKQATGKTQIAMFPFFYIGYVIALISYLK